MNSIFKRRSIRNYTEEPISREQIDLIVKAGMNAPSAHNQRPARYVIIEDQEILEGLATRHDYAKMLSKAAFGMLVYFDRDEVRDKDFVQQDCAASVENMLVQATEMGIGSVWIGVYPNMVLIKRIKEIISLKDSELPFALISFGMPKEKKPGRDFYEPSWVKYV